MRTTKHLAATQEAAFATTDKDNLTGLSEAQLVSASCKSMFLRDSGKTSVHELF
jgi:hypothetical protein